MRYEPYDGKRSGEADGPVGPSSAQRGRDQNCPVRFWIITMLLVLFGLSTLKLR
ncbi:MAG: hypothetical protein U1F52_02930 [Burkholderiales bacterium]